MTGRRPSFSFLCQSVASFDFDRSSRSNNIREIVFSYFYCGRYVDLTMKMRTELDGDATARRPCRPVFECRPIQKRRNKTRAIDIIACPMMASIFGHSDESIISLPNETNGFPFNSDRILGFCSFWGPIGWLCPLVISSSVDPKKGPSLKCWKTVTCHSIDVFSSL